MADRFPLIVNSVSKKIEELVSGDNLDLTGNGIIVSGDTGASKYLTSNGTTVFWDSPGDVYLTQNQTVTNKTFETCIISGSLNTITNIPNASLSNSSITINGSAISLGGTVTTPDNNTTYSVSTVDGASASEKIIRLTSGGNAGAGVDDDITLAVGAPASVPAGSNALTLFLDRSGDVLTVSGHVNDSDTITTLSAPGGTATSGALNFTSSGAATVSMTGSTINVSALDTDTKTKIRAGSGGTYGPADTTTGKFTFLDGTGTTVAAGVDNSGDPTITYESTDTVTRIRGGSTGSYVPSSGGTTQSDVTITGGSGGNVTVSQVGNTINIDSVDTNTVTKVGSDNNGSPIAPQAGDFVFKQAGATTIRQTTNNSGQVEIEIDSLNSDTGASLDADPVGGLVLSGTDFQLKNYNNLTGNKLVKWDSGNNQLSNSIIDDDGTTVTIGGDLVVSGTQTILNTTTLQVEDNIIELRKGNSITGADGGIQVNRITDSSGVVTAYQGLQWHESGGYWRSWDGSVDNRFVTENETQVLTNKTLTNPTFTTPTLGAASATSINGLEITSTASAILEIQSGKKVDIDRDLTFTSDNLTSNVNVNFRVGGDVVYKSDTLASLSSTTSTQLRTLISGTTGTDDLVFQTSPVILTSLVTTSTGFALLNSGAQSIQFGGAATQIEIGNQSGTTTISGDTVIEKDLTVGQANTDIFTCNARIDIVNSDILIRGGSTDPMTVGRGNGAVATNTAVGKQALSSVSSGSQNTATGYESLLTVNSGAGNTAYGYHTLRSIGVGTNNVAVGRSTMLGNLEGNSNTALGSNALETNTTGDANVCIGFYAGYNCSGNGNVLIGPADSTNPDNDATYTPPSAGGDRQLIIGSGTEYWVKGDSNFDVTLNNDVTVNNSLTVKGDFIVNGVTTTVQSNVLEVADKNIELAKVVSTTFTCTTTDGSANISSISPTLGLIPGMAITSNTAGVTVPGNTTIVSITGNVATLSNNVTGSGTPTFSAIGPSDTAADGGGIILKGSPSDHTFTWSNATDSWQSSEDMELAVGKTYNIIDGAGNARQMISLTQIGPTAGTGVVATLGTGVTGSSLTSVGTLASLTVSGGADIGSFTASESIFDNNVAIGGTHPWTVAGSGFNNLSISGDDNTSSGFINLGAGATVTNADFDLGRIRFWNNATEVAQIAGTTGDSNNDTGRISFSTKQNTGSLTERLRIGHDGKTKLITALTTDYLEYGNNPRLWLKCPDGINGLRIDASTTPLEIKNSSASGKSFSFDSNFNFNVNGDYELATNDFDSSGKIFLNATRNNGSSTVTAFQTSIQAVALSNANNDGYLGLGSSATPDELKIHTNGQVDIGTAGTLRAIINQASNNGHYFASQCDDNSNGFEVYQLHGVTSTRKSFVVAANTGASGAKEDQFSVRGDGNILVNAPASNAPAHSVHIRNGFLRLQAGSQAFADFSQQVGVEWSQEDGSDVQVGKIVMRRDAWGGAPHNMDFYTRNYSNSVLRALILHYDQNATLTGTLTQSGSDIRLKENINQIPDALTKVNSLTGFTYNWNETAQDLGYKGGDHDDLQVGLSAQDVEKIQPEVIKPMGADPNYKTIQYERLIPLLVESIKELSAKNTALEARVEELEK